MRFRGCRRATVACGTAPFIRAKLLAAERAGSPFSPCLAAGPSAVAAVSFRWRSSGAGSPVSGNDDLISAKFLFSLYSASRREVSGMKHLPRLLAQTVAAVAIALFWSISAVGTTVGTTVGLTTLATAINAATSTPAEARRRRRGRRGRGRRWRGRRGRGWYGYPYYGYGYPYRRRGWGGVSIRIW